MLTFYLIRHGQKEAIPFDPALTAFGIKQAEVTKELLMEVSFKEILSSPKLRAKQTAEIIAKPHSLPIKTDERLIERLEWESEETFEAFIAEWNKTDIDRSYLPKKGISSKTNGERMKNILIKAIRWKKRAHLIISDYTSFIEYIITNKRTTTVFSYMQLISYFFKIN